MNIRDAYATLIGVALVPVVIYCLFTIILYQKVDWVMVVALFFGSGIGIWLVMGLMPMPEELLQEEEDEEEAQLNEEKLQEEKKNNDYRREFVGNVSHELKTPIFNIQGYLETLIEGGLNDPEVNMKYLEKAKRSTERLISIVEDLDAITGFESGQLDLYIQKINLTETVRDVFESLEQKAREFDITLKADTDKPTWVMGDKRRIRQVLTNLVDNSIKYGRDGGSTTVRLIRHEDNIEVEVADNGIGIAKKHLPRLFERFYRVDASRSRDRGGTGLGLSIVKHILDAHGQTINVRSTQGRGSTFSFTLKKG